MSIIASPSQPNISDQFNLTCVVWVNSTVVDVSVRVDIQWSRTAIQASDHISISEVTRNEHGYQRSILITEVLISDARSYICDVTISPNSSSTEFIDNFVNSSSHELILGIIIIIAQQY